LDCVFLFRFGFAFAVGVGVGVDTGTGVGVDGGMNYFVVDACACIGAASFIGF
jgi:hypothetical protein